MKNKINVTNRGSEKHTLKIKDSLKESIKTFTDGIHLGKKNMLLGY